MQYNSREVKMIKKFNVKERCQSFCDGTSMHGFAELYHSKSVGWSIFWVVLLISTIGLTIYQMIMAIDQFMIQSSSTRTELAHEYVLYPDVKICSQHWLYWLDWNKAISLNFTKESVLYGMSHVTNIYTLDSFDIDEAKTQFQETMALNNFTRMRDFYHSVAKDLPLEESSTEYSNAFKLHHFIYSANLNSIVMCYTTPGELIKKVMSEKRFADPFDFFIYLTPKSFSWESEYLKLDEYNWYMSEFFLQNMNNMYVDDQGDRVKNFSGYTLPLIMCIHGFTVTCFDENLSVTPIFDEYTISVSIQVHRWLPTTTNKCLVDPRHINSNGYCNDSGSLHMNSLAKCNLIGPAIMSDTDSPENMCRKQLFKISIHSNIATSLWVPETPYEGTLDMISHSYPVNCMLPCEIWSYSLSYVATKFSPNNIENFFSKAYTTITLIYPRNILITIEIESRTWEDFIANIGGLLGVWSGSSLLSIVQLFYLCCFAPKRNNFRKFERKINDFDTLSGNLNIQTKSLKQENVIQSNI